MRSDDGSTLALGALAVATGLTLIESRRYPPGGSRAAQMTEARRQALMKDVLKKAAWVGYSGTAGWGSPATRYASAFPTVALASMWIPHYEKQDYKRVSHLEKPTRKHSFDDRIESWLTPSGNLGPEMGVRTILGGRQVLNVEQYGRRLTIPFEVLPSGVRRRLQTILLTERLGRDEHNIAVMNALAEDALANPEQARQIYGELAWYYRDYSARWAQGR
jgi:hypothetical protein